MAASKFPAKSRQLDAFFEHELSGRVYDFCNGPFTRL